MQETVTCPHCRYAWFSLGW